MRRPRFGAAAVCLIALAALAAKGKDKPSVEEVRVDGSHLEQTSRCNKHGVLRVLANDSHLLIAGDCTDIVVVGANNWIQVEHADWIRMRGNLNTVLYQDPSTQIDDRGKGNSVAEKWPQ
jgi:hypothetical protein